MFDTVKRIIADGVRDLPGLNTRIDEMYAVGDLTRAEADELKTLAVEQASGYGSVSRTLEAVVTALEEKIAILESAISSLNTQTDDSAGETSGKKPTAGLPTYSDGMVAADGSIWLYNGGVWKSIAGDYGLCWSPDVLPQYWQDVSEEYDI